MVQENDKKINTSKIRKATRQKAKLRIGLAGTAGSGKTYSALLMASGIAPWSKIVLIDTENGSGDLYAHLGEYNIYPLTAPFSPEKYVQAIKECESAGMEVIIIDSVTHEWEGKGGCLESNELLGQSKFKGNTWAAWSVTTPRHQKFLEAITTANAHVITTVRSKSDTIQTEDKKIKKVGTKEIQREGFEYELTVSFTIDRDRHYATASKDRTSIFIDSDPFIISKETGQILLEWCEQGIEPLLSPEEKAEAELKALRVELSTVFYKLAKKKGWDQETMDKNWIAVTGGHIEKLSANSLTIFINGLKEKLNKKS